MATETAEQRAAIERLRKSRDGGYLSYGGDEQTVADLYLAEHPADDAEPVTEEWMRSVGFTGIGDKEFGDAYGNRQILAMFPNSRMGFLITVGDEGPAVKVETRGDVRRLCTALGIPLAATS